MFQNKERDRLFKKLRKLKNSCDNPSTVVDYDLSDYKIEFHEDVEGDFNRGMQVDMFLLSVKNIKKNRHENVGYLSSSWIPLKRFKNHYKNGAIDYCAKIRGERSKNIDTCDIETVLTMHPDAPFWNKRFQLYMLSDDEWNEHLLKYIEYNSKKYSKEFENFKNFHIDKQHTDFIHINESFRGKRLYQLLYFAACNKYGKFYSSALKSEEAKRAWENLKMNLPTEIVAFEEDGREGIKLV
jgi:hypothetical protein